MYCTYYSIYCWHHFLFTLLFAWQKDWLYAWNAFIARPTDSWHCTNPSVQPKRTRSSCTGILVVAHTRTQIQRHVYPKDLIFIMCDIMETSHAHPVTLLNTLPPTLFRHCTSIIAFSYLSSSFAPWRVFSLICLLALFQQNWTNSSCIFCRHRHSGSTIVQCISVARTWHIRMEFPCCVCASPKCKQFYEKTNTKITNSKNPALFLYGEHRTVFSFRIFLK